MENIATNKRNLMNPDELLKLDNNKEIVIVRGRKPFICNKYDYSKHIEASKKHIHLIFFFFIIFHLHNFIFVYQVIPFGQYQ